MRALAAEEEVDCPVGPANVPTLGSVRSHGNSKLELTAHRPRVPVGFFPCGNGGGVCFFVTVAIRTDLAMSHVGRHPKISLVEGLQEDTIHSVPTAMVDIDVTVTSVSYNFTSAAQPPSPWLCRP